MIPVPCETCRLVAGCRNCDVMARECVFAWLAELRVECAEYSPDYYHGVEGVFA